MTPRTFFTTPKPTVIHALLLATTILLTTLVTQDTPKEKVEHPKH